MTGSRDLRAQGAVESTLHERALGVSVFLGQDWEFSAADSHNRSAAIVGPNGMVIILSPARFDYSSQGRLEIWGRYPEFSHGDNRVEFSPLQGERLSITVSAARADEDIAKDILRRFVPRYAELYRDGLERKAQYVSDHERMEVALNDLAAALREDRASAMQDRWDQVRILQSGLYGHFQVTYNGHKADLKVSGLPIALACQIATLFGQLEDNPREAGI